jgi:hypothetical protein
VVEDRDGRIVFDGFDAAEVDADGRIAVLLTFGGASPTPFPQDRFHVDAIESLPIKVDTSITSRDPPSDS